MNVRFTGSRRSEAHKAVLNVRFGGNGTRGAELVEQRGLRADRVAVELNGEIVPRAQRAQTQLKGTDTLEIVTFVQGG